MAKAKQLSKAAQLLGGADIKYALEPALTTLAHNLSSPPLLAAFDDQRLKYVCYEQEPGRRAAANLLTRDKARLIAMIAKLRVLVRK
jgi:hypothetical protein